ncbi:hypothetical protein NC653_037666 [Populus alba x Populus x berolinensis]|uniref:Uncharacterized protein n=1 Tax=Populus alba x Populus x berolinensis TaxID=444605 RepID=A0AAD6LET3_9ROSI|nr:hypothetical protein NC653_037666 [Populus alba x Populus x berolinensis]
MEISMQVHRKKSPSMENTLAAIFQDQQHCSYYLSVTDMDILIMNSSTGEVVKIKTVILDKKEFSLMSFLMLKEGLASEYCTISSPKWNPVAYLTEFLDPPHASKMSIGGDMKLKVGGHLEVLIKETKLGALTV